MPSESPGWVLIPRSPKVRDHELHLGWQMRGMSKREPTVGLTLRELQGDARSHPELDTFGFWKIRAIHGGRSDAMLILTPDQPATEELFEGEYCEDDPYAKLGPSDRWTEWRDHGWPGIIRGQPQNYPLFKNTDYLGFNVVLDEIPYTVAPTEFTFDVFWTSDDPCPDVVKPNRPRPSIVYWPYPGVTVTNGGSSRLCLHEEIDTLPTSGLLTWFGRASNNLNKPGIKFSATPQKTWTRHIYNIHKKKTNGSYRTIVEWASPPWNALEFPISPIQYTS